MVMLVAGDGPDAPMLAVVGASYLFDLFHG
jgi:hypothetical protein